MADSSPQTENLPSSFPFFPLFFSLDKTQSIKKTSWIEVLDMLYYSVIMKIFKINTENKENVLIP